MMGANSGQKNTTEAVAMVTAQPDHIKQLLPWFTSSQAMFIWGGAGIRFPTDSIHFLQDIGWLKLASIALVPESQIQEPEQKLLGFAQVYLRLGRYHFGRVAVSPEYRGKGVGQHFLTSLMQSIQESQNCIMSDFAQWKSHPEGFIHTESQRLILPFKANGFSLFVLEGNQPAIECYQRLGFEAIDYPDKLSGDFKKCRYMVC